MNQNMIYIILAAVAIVIIGIVIYLLTRTSSPTFVGCYIDKNVRAIPNYGYDPMTFEECEALARKNGDTIFGFQDGGPHSGNPIGSGQCWTGTDMTRAQQYGKA